ncbi:MAG TPA: uracil-DNA glycosylase [bacterium]|nr:uracil-DNA glycosylase [bacterium]
MTKEQKLKSIADTLAKDMSLPLKEGATNDVPGTGSANADVVFIGEAPGKHEDEKGVPFCGAAGKFLDELLASIDLTREDVFITNIVKHRPPENRDPKPEEVQAYWPYLEQQLAVIEPKVIVVLGRHSLARLMPGLGTISMLHGRAFKKQNRTYMALYHPAVALYNGGMRKVLLEDFQKLGILLKKLNIKK